MNPLLINNDDDVDIPSSSSSSGVDRGMGEEGVLPAMKLTYQDTELEELVDELGKVGFDCAMAWLVKQEIARVEAALALYRSKPPSSIKNPAGYIRYLVKSPGKIPMPGPPMPPGLDPDKYIKGRYGHMVIRTKEDLKRIRGKNGKKSLG